MKSDVKKFRLKRDIFIPWEAMESPAFWKLSGTAVRILLRLMQKRVWAERKRRRKGRRPDFVNGGIAFTYTEAAAFGIGKSTFPDAIKQLVTVGFVDIEHQGGGVGRDYSRYAISDRWRDFGTDRFVLVEKKRVLQPGLDVRAWQAKRERREQIKKTTGNRTCQVRETVPMQDKQDEPGTGKS
jgi:hypothetical protein